MIASRRLLLGSTVSAGAAALLIATTDVGAVADRLQRAQVGWLALALPVLAVQVWIRAARWSLLVGAASNGTIHASRTLDPMLVGYFVNAVAPGRLGELARTLVVSRREALAFSAVAASVVVERAIDLMALAGLASIALLLSASTWAIPFGIVAVAITTAILFGSRASVLQRLLPRQVPPKLADGVREFLRAVAAIPIAVSGRAALMSGVAWCGDVLLVLLVSRALGLNISAAAAVTIGLGGSLGTALPAAPGYLATYELGAVALGALAGVPRETVIPIAILTHLVGVLVLAAAGAVALGRVSGFVRLDALFQRNRLTAAAEER